MAYALPIVATIEDGGVAFRVRALPWGLAREASRGADEEALAAKVYDRCVEVVDGDKPPLDDLPASLVARLVQASAGVGEGNPPSPPRSTAPVSGG